MGDEWISSNYSIVDITEYERGLEEQRLIEDFCIRFFKEYWAYPPSKDTLVQTCRGVMKGDQRLTTDICKNLNAQNFDISFRAMCRELFRDGIEDKYVVALLIFCIELDIYLQNNDWYTISVLIDSLVSALKNEQFKAPIVTQAYTFTDFANSLVNLVPSLLLFYVLFR